MGVPATGVSLTNLLSRAFKPSFSQPPLEVAVPTIQWQPVTVMTPTVQVYKMGEHLDSRIMGGIWDLGPYR
jgi:hypothetical protein